MSRLTFGGRRYSGLPNKRDTPLKTTVRRWGRRKPVRHYDALPEEAEAEKVITLNPALSDIKPGHCEPSTLHGRSSALLGDSEDIAVLSLAPNSRKSSPRVSPAACMKIPVISGSTTSPSLESDVISSSDNDEDEYSCSSTASSSLPSPEIFRKETCEEVPVSSFREEVPAVLHNKNSTLLDVSDAIGIHMHPAPNLSTIFDNSDFQPCNNFKTKNHRGSEPEVKLRSSISSANNVAQSNTALKLTKKQPILLKKKVCFKTPLTESKHDPAGKLPDHHDGEPFQTSGPVKHMKPGDHTPKASRMDSEEMFQSKMRLKRSTAKTPERAKFFDFSCDSESEAFFQKMKERCDELWSISLFPLTAGNTQNCSS